LVRNIVGILLIKGAVEMSKSNLNINFNIFEKDQERQELQKQQVYINELKDLIVALQTEVAALKKRLDASPY